MRTQIIMTVATLILGVGLGAVGQWALAAPMADMHAHDVTACVTQQHAHAINNILANYVCSDLEQHFEVPAGTCDATMFTFASVEPAKNCHSGYYARVRAKCEGEWHAVHD